MDGDTVRENRENGFVIKGAESGEPVKSYRILSKPDRVDVVFRRPGGEMVLRGDTPEQFEHTCMLTEEQVDLMQAKGIFVREVKDGG